MARADSRTDPPRGRQTDPHDADRRPAVGGAVVDAQTRCAHYAGALDVVAIRFRCCDRWYPCLHCHDASEDHAPTPWPRAEHDAAALLCGVCGTRLTIRAYLAADAARPACPACGAGFNPGCRRHHPVYFES